MAERSEIKGQIDLSKCRQQEVANFNPSWSPLSDKVATRYLGDAYKNPGEILSRFKSVDLAVASKLSKFIFNIAELTDEVLEQFVKEGEQAKKEFGPKIIAFATAKGLMKDLSASEAQKLVFTRTDLSEAADEEDHWQFSKGWEVFETEDTREPILLVTKHINKVVRFDSVKLGEIYKADPEFLRTMIRDLNEKQSLAFLRDHLSFDEELHEVGEANIVPTFLSNLVSLPDEGQREAEMRSLTNFLKWIGSLGPDFASAIYNLQNKLSNKRVDLKSARRVDLPYYLKHVSSCPSMPDKTAKRSQWLLKAYNTFLGVDDHSPKTGLNEAILKNPTYAFINLDKNEKNWKQELNQRSEAAKLSASLIEKSEDIQDREAFLKLLKEDFPELHKTLVKFQEWLGNDLMKRSNFNELISDTRRWLAYQTPDLDGITKNLQEQLGHILRISNIEQDFDGIFIPKWPTDSIWISNIHLTTILPLLVIKEEQAQAFKDKTDYLGNKSRKIEDYNKLLNEFKTNSEQKAKVAKDELKRIENTRKAVQDLKAKLKIDDSEIANVINSVSEMVTRKDGERELSTDHYRFTILLNTLVMHKRGVVNMHSPVFKEFLAFVFPPRELA